MRLKPVVLLAAMILAAGCNGKDAGEPAAGNRAESNAATEKKHPTYCFFKDAETKGWRATRDRSGDVVVTGKAHVKDARYKALIGNSEISGDQAILWLTIGENGGYAAPEDWWDVATTIPNSSGTAAVSLQCGKKIVAELSVPK